MKNAPIIKSAIPKQRYRLADFELVVLGDVITEDDIEYHHLLAVIAAGASEPVLYVSYETGVGESEPRLRIITEQENRQYSLTQDLHDAEQFARAAIETTQKVFQISDQEEPFKIM